MGTEVTLVSAYYFSGLTPKALLGMIPSIEQPLGAAGVTLQNHTKHKSKKQNPKEAKFLSTLIYTFPGNIQPVGTVAKCKVWSRLGEISPRRGVLVC